MLICIEKNYHYRHHHHNTPDQHTWIVLPLGSQSKRSYPITFQNSQAFSAFSIRSATGKERVSWAVQPASTCPARQAQRQNNGQPSGKAATNILVKQTVQHSPSEANEPNCEMIIGLYTRLRVYKLLIWYSSSQGVTKETGFSPRIYNYLPKTTSTLFTVVWVFFVLVSAF